MARSNPRAHNPVLLYTAAPAIDAAVRGQIGHKGIHRFLRVLNRNIRVLPVSPKMRMTYCAPRLPRIYRLPGVAVPRAVKGATPLGPRRIGSSPGPVPPGSTAGRPGIAPNSTPLNESPS